MWRQLHQSQLLIQHMQIDEKNAEKKSNAEVLQSENAILINDLGDKVVDDE